MIDLIVALVESQTSPFSLLNGWAIGGAASRVAAGRHRRRRARGRLRAAADRRLAARRPDGERHRAWVREGWEALRPHTAGRQYATFLSDEGPAGVRAAYGDRLARLVALKDRVRPGQRLPSQRQHPTQRGRNPMKVLVTGATGNVGAHVVRALRERGVAVRAFVRDRDRAAHMLGEDVELAVGDFGDRDSLERALRGTQRLFLACGNAPAQVEHECAAIDAAAAAGVERVVKLSGPAPASTRRSSSTTGTARSRRTCARSGLPWVAAAPERLHDQPAPARRQRSGSTGTLFAPAGAAEIAFIDPRDVGESRPPRC